MKTCLIMNSTAGSMGETADQLRDLADRHHVPIKPTKQPGDAARFAKSALDSGVQRILVAGGDGTISQVVHGVAPQFPEIELAILPMGTGNDLARSLDLPLDDVQAAFKLALEGRAVPIDLVKILNGSESYFVNAANGGVAGKVASEIEEEGKERWGAFAYWMAAIKEIAALELFEVLLELDDTTVEAEVYSAVVSNGKYVGGGFAMAPSAVLNDGLLDIALLSVPLATKLLEVGVRSVFGSETTNQPTWVHRARKVRFHVQPPMLFSIDGEPMNLASSSFEVIPQCLPVVGNFEAEAKAN